MRSFVAKGFSALVVGLIVFAPVIIAHPAPTSISRVSIQMMFKQADLVAILRILSGDSENYPTAVYKAEVVQSFKGATQGAIIYLGPYNGYGVGKELLVFLQRSEKGIEPKQQTTGPRLSYGAISSFFQVMYGGYSALNVEYECVFEGKEPAQQCDDAIRVNTSQVNLSNIFASATKSASSDAISWVRKREIVTYLERLAAWPD